MRKPKTTKTKRERKTAKQRTIDALLDIIEAAPKRGEPDVAVRAAAVLLPYVI